MSERDPGLGRILIGGSAFLLAIWGVVQVAQSNAIFRDGNGNINTDLGPLNLGECKLGSSDNRRPLTEPQMKATIQEIGRLCGYCDPTTIMTDTATGIGYIPCADLNAIEILNNPDGSYTVHSYLTTKPVGAPEGFVYNFLHSNPGLCDPTLGAIEGEMSADFSKRFDPAISALLLPRIEQAPSSDACPERPLTSAVSLP